MTEEQEQKILRAIFHLAGVTYHSAEMIESATEVLTDDHRTRAIHHHKEIFNLINPELQFPKHERPT